MNIGPVQTVINVKDPGDRLALQNYFLSNNPSAVREEIHCIYSYKFEDGKEHLTVKQYKTGKLHIQGKAGPLYNKLIKPALDRYSLEVNKTVVIDKATPPGYPYIGTDESGKGDYFGPLVIAAVWLDEELEACLEKMGVRDSKVISDGECHRLAGEIRKSCDRCYVEVEITPERYNSLYAEFKKEKKNLNHLLAWGHARALESILTARTVKYAVADKFGNEKYLLSRLMKKGKNISLIQSPKAERYTAVAAASILARDRFMTRLDQLERECKMTLPKGASQLVLKHSLLVGNTGQKS